MSEAQQGLRLAVELAPDQFNALAQRVAEHIAEGRDDGFLDVEGACAFLGGCSRKAVYALVERRRIRSHRVGARLLFDATELRADVERGQ